MARHLVIGQLKSTNFQFIEANDGEEGLEKLHENQDICLIFTDINMPRMSGIEMISELKKNPKLSQIPICLLTTETGSDAITQAKQLGVNAFLVKPVQKEQLLAVLNGYTTANFN